MKRLFTFLTAVLIIATIYAQSPEKFSYQAVVRNSGGVLIQSSNVGIKVSLLQGSSSGTIVYSETHGVVTNVNGLVTLEIGGGIVVSGTFATIDWSAGPYFLKTETDPAGGSNYTITGTSQLLSVPYALYAANSGTPGPQGPIGLTGADGKSIVWRGEWNAVEKYVVNDAVSYGGSSYIATDASVNENPLTKFWNLLSQKGDQGIQGLTGATGGYPVHTIGESYGGGIVFYVYDNGQHGLIAATADQTPAIGIRWDNGTTVAINVVRDGIHAGQYNTERIIAFQGAGNYAAQLCANYTGGGYGDWYLPSKFELNLLYQQKNVVGGFVDNDYWSSTEYNSVNAYYQYITNGVQGNFYKYGYVSVRAIRAF